MILLNNQLVWNPGISCDDHWNLKWFYAKYRWACERQAEEARVAFNRAQAHTALERYRRGRDWWNRENRIDEFEPGYAAHIRWEEEQWERKNPQKETLRLP